MEGVPCAIGRLPPHLQARVRAQHVVSSLAEALAECVGNSLDAGASEVNVELDLAGLGFRVQDNGSGVASPRLALLAQQLQLRGAVGSAGRLPAGASSSGGGGGSSSGMPARLGYRGEALAAICATAATVELTSRATGSFETHCLVLRRGSGSGSASGSGSSGGLAAQLGLALEQRSRQGSVVSVRDMFFNQPVRRKALLAAGWVLRRAGCCSAQPSSKPELKPVELDLGRHFVLACPPAGCPGRLTAAGRRWCGWRCCGPTLPSPSSTEAARPFSCACSRWAAGGHLAAKLCGEEQQHELATHALKASSSRLLS